MPAARADDEPPVTGALEVLATAAGRPARAVIELRGEPVEPRAPLAAGRPLRTAHTAENGRARFEDLVPGPYEVRVVAGEAPATLGSVTIPTSGGLVALRIPCGTGPHALEGRATWRDGTPFRGWLSLCRDESFCGTFAGTCGQMFVQAEEAGRFRFAGLPPGSYGLGAQAGPRAFVVQDECELLLPLDGPVVYVVDEGGGRVHGRVVAARDGTPVTGAQLEVRSLGPWRLARTQADASGAYALRVPEAIRPELLVEAEGFAPQWVPLVQGDQRIDVRLVRPGTVVGRVLTKGAGTPVKGAVVHAVWDAVGEEQSIHRTATTDAQGRYELRGLVPGRNTLFVLGSGWATSGPSPWDGRRSETLEVEVEAGGVASRDLRAVRAASVRIEVTTAQGEPALPAAVAIEPEVGRVFEGSTWRLPPSDSYRGRSVDRAGCVEFDDLIPGVPHEGTLEALDDFFSLAIPALEPGARHVHRETLPMRERLAEGPRPRVEPAPAGAPRIAGRVRGPAVLDRHLVELKVEGLTEGGAPDGNASHRTVHAPCGGRFAFEGLEAKHYLLKARARWSGASYVARKLVKAQRTGLEVTLEPQRPGPKTERSIRVVDAEDRPVPRARGWVYWQFSLGIDDPLAARVHGGVLTFEPVPGAGDHLWIEILDARDAMGRDVGAGGHVLGPWPRGEVPQQIRLPAARSVRGRVVDPEGHGVAGALVVALPVRPIAERARGRFVGAIHARARTDQGGAFTARGLGTGPYQVTVDPPEGFAWPDFSGPVAGDAEGLSIRLVRAVTAQLEIVDGEGKPLPGASVQVQWEASDGRPCAFMQFEAFAFPWSESPWGIRKTWTAGAGGGVELRGLHPKERYTISIRAPPGRADLRPVTLRPDWTPQETERIVIRKR